MSKEFPKGEIIIYKASDGQTQLDVKLEEETVWLTQKQMSFLFQKDIRTINEHIKNIFKEGELSENSVIRNFRITASDGKSYKANFYNLDVIISVGYRVKSKRGAQFRIWANRVLKDYLVKGYALNEKRLKEQKEKVKELEKTLEIFSTIVESYKLKLGYGTMFLSVVPDLKVGLF
ncbi:MAG: RhuM family protein [Ignavibacteriaceae bacterium]